MRDGLLTLAVGTLFGYLVTAIASPLLSESQVLGATGESTPAHEFMARRLEDPASLIVLKIPTDRAKQIGTDVVADPSTDVATRAMKLQVFAAANANIKATPVSLTYLGGGSEGRLQVQLYAAELDIQTQDGDRLTIIGYIVSLVNSRVFLLE
jgi:hypothetical protein